MPKYTLLSRVYLGDEELYELLSSKNVPRRELLRTARRMGLVFSEKAAEQDVRSALALLPSSWPLVSGVLKSIEKPDREERKTSIHVNNCDEKTDVAEIIKQTQTARADKFSEVYMDLDDFLGPKPTVIDLRAKDRWEAIDELVGHLAVTNKIRPDHQEAILAAVRRREKAMSTGVGFEIGLPHASSDLVSEVVGVVGRSHLGIPFDARDGKPVKLVLLFLVPAGQFHKHLNTLANIAKLLHRKDFRDGLWGRFT